MDLSLIPLKDLIDEIESRTSCFICAYELPEDKKQTVEFKYGKGSWFNAVKLSAILNNDILNNWKGELRTLQELNDRYKEEENS